MPPVFTSSAFDLLAAIAQMPSAAFYFDHKVEFKTLVEQPLQRLMTCAAARLPLMLRERLETRRNVFSRFLKNDFGHGGAWANYWGAFYPKGSRRLADVQLAVWMNATRLQISFYIGDYAGLPRERFLRNTARLRHRLPGLLADLIGDPRVLISHGPTVVGADGNFTVEQPISWGEWLDDPAAADFWVRAAYTPEQVFSMPGETLEERVVALHSAYFPLALLAMEDEPLPLIEAYLGIGGA